MPTLSFAFDFISPYAFLAWRQLPALCARHGVTLQPVPTLLAAVLTHFGQKGPAEIPAKRLHTFRHVFRLGHRLGTPLTLPAAHPFNPLLPLRLASLPALEADTRAAVIDALFTAAWQRGAPIYDAPGVLAALAAFPEAADWVAQAQSPAAKAALTSQTEAMIAAGVFGVPAMIWEGEVFWGVDSLPDLEAALRGEDPLPPGWAEVLTSLPAQATRR